MAARRRRGNTYACENYPQNASFLLTAANKRCAAGPPLGKWHDNARKMAFIKGGFHQRINLSPVCSSIGVALHEIGHILGMAHEVERSDRDDYIKIHWNNVVDRK